MIVAHSPFTVEDLRNMQKLAYHPSEDDPKYKHGYADGALDFFLKLKKLLEEQNGHHA